MPLVAGTTLGPYTILSPLGSGGMGEVYRARDTRLNRDVAIKILPEGFATDAIRLARFEREARATSALNHPNILHIYDIGLAGDTPYIAMELVDGDTLRRRLANGVDIDTTVDWMSRVAEALAKAHAAGIVHRDLKPENIMISADGHVKVLDFGLAKMLASDTPAAVTETRAGDSLPGMIVGSVGYMSPEQAQASVVDHRSDVFSFGCILHEMLGGRAAFGGNSVLDTLHQLVHGTAAALPATIAPSLRQIVERCLVKEPGGRYGSMKEIVDDLRAASRGGAAVVAAPEASRSIAVLPFDDLSATKDSEYLGAGVAEEIITSLSTIDAMRVVARASATAVKGTGQSIPQIAGVLGVRYIVTGSVRRAGNRLRISAQLVDATRDITLWAQNFNGTMDDIFDIQESTARAIAAQLRLEISSDASGRLRRRPIADIQAYEGYLRARHHLYKFTPAALQAAMQEISAALERSGPNALLYVTKGLIEWQSFNIGVSQDAETLNRAADLARQSLAIDPLSAGAETLLGLIETHRPNLPAAIGHLERAIARDGSDVDAVAWLLLLSTLRGRNAQARPLAQRLAVIDPLGPLTRLSTVMLAYMDGDFELALQHLERYEERGLFESALRVQLLSYLRRFEEAARLSDELLRDTPDDIFARMAAMVRFASQGDRRRVEQLFDDTLRGAARNDLQYSAWIAEAFAQLGDVEQAVAWLRNAISRGYLAYPFTAQHNWLFDPVRAAPAFQATLEEMRIAWLAASS